MSARVPSEVSNGGMSGRKAPIATPMNIHYEQGGEVSGQGGGGEQ